MASYGTSDGQLANLPGGDVDTVISSPPFTPDQPCASQSKLKANIAGREKRSSGLDSDGQLGALPEGNLADAVLSSPPYEGSEGSPSLGSVNKDSWGEEGTDITARRGLTAKYGVSRGQLGHTKGETFWSAAKQIVAECHAILKPGGIAIFVSKDFVRKGQRVSFSDDWQRLCESVGFEPIERIRAWLVKEERHPGLFGEDVVKTKQRKSFFRRLAEQKGSPRIDWEDVIVMRKPKNGCAGL